MRELLERVEAANGPDRELDAGIVVGLGLDNTCPFWLHSYDRTTPVRITASVDAALALVERVLPGHRVALFTNGGGEGPTCVIMFESDPVKADERAPTLPLAILAAMLKALIAQADGK